MWKRFVSLFSAQSGDVPCYLVEKHLPANRPIPTLDSLAELANILLECEDDHGPDAYERSPDDTPQDLLRMQFAHCWCRHFAGAVHELTGWPVVSAREPDGSLVHFFNRSPQGKWVDVTGFVSLEDLRQRYGVTNLVLREHDDFPLDPVIDDESMSTVMAAMLYLPHEPFVSMKPTAELWVRQGRIGMDGPWRWQPEQAAQP